DGNELGWGYGLGAAPRPAAGSRKEPGMIRLDTVTMTYPAGTRPALRDVTLRIDEGEFVFLVGPSGSGKSTLLRLLLREERATSGLVTIDGVDLAAIPDRRVPLLRRTI